MSNIYEAEKTKRVISQMWRMRIVASGTSQTKESAPSEVLRSAKPGINTGTVAGLCSETIR